MINLNINPHLAAVEILDNARARGDRFAHDDTIVVLADLYRTRKVKEQEK